jgi:hypothetical protein
MYLMHLMHLMYLMYLIDSVSDMVHEREEANKDKHLQLEKINLQFV